MKKLLQASLALTLFVSLTQTAQAHDYRIGDLTIKHPVARATPPGAKSAAGYLIIQNTGDTDDRLIGASAEISETTQVHEMRMDGEMMKMRHLDDGLPIPAGAEVVLESGGYHLMFIGLKNPLKPGEKFAGTLTFENAGDLEIVLNVKKITGHMHHGKDKKPMKHKHKMKEGSNSNK